MITLLKIKSLIKLSTRCLAERRPSVGSVRVGSSRTPWFLFVDFSDKRGRRLAIHGLSQPEIRNLWFELCDKLQPTIVIDIGANYGEFSLSQQIPSARKVWLIEANETLCHFLRKTIENFPSSSLVELSNVIAGPSDLHDTAQTIFINTSWSGMSSVLSSGEKKDIRESKVRSISIDRELKTGSSESRVAFKIDVEGFEGQVLEGMTELISQSEACLGLIEFNKDSLRSAGTDPDKLLGELLLLGDVYYLNAQDGTLQQVTTDNTEQIAIGKQDIFFIKNFLFSPQGTYI